MENSVFVVTKPLQYFNAKNIKTDDTKILLIVNSFPEADTFADKVKTHSKYWNEIYHFDTYIKAFKWLILNSSSFKTLYLDSDFGVLKYLWIFNLRSKTIFVYEEGISAYVQDLRKDPFLYNLSDNNPLRNFKRRAVEYIYRALGNENYQGGNKYTKGIYIYDIERRKKIIPGYKKELRQFNKSFLDHLRTDVEKHILYEKDKRLLEGARGKKVLLYLSSWSIDSEIEEKLDKYRDYVKVLKLHPHIRDAKLEDFSSFDYIAKGGTMVEFLITDLLDITQDITILHHGSSALLYLENASNIDFIEI